MIDFLMLKHALHAWAEAYLIMVDEYYDCSCIRFVQRVLMSLHT